MACSLFKACKVERLDKSAKSCAPATPALAGKAVCVDVSLRAKEGIFCRAEETVL